MASGIVFRGTDGFNSVQSFTTALTLAQAMTTALMDLTIAECEMGSYDGQDPAFAAYTDALDEARTRVLALCNDLLALPMATVQAAYLQRAAILVRTVVGSDDPAEVERIGSALSVTRWIWQVPGTLPGHHLYIEALGAALEALLKYIDGPNGPQDDPPTAAPHLTIHAGSWDSATYPVPVAHTAMSAAFTGLLRNLDACVAAERRIQRDIVPDALAPECAEDLRAAEAAKEVLITHLAEVLDQPVERALDRPLGLLARDLKALLSIEDDGDRVHLHGLMVRNADLLLVRGSAPATRRVRALQVHYFRSVARLMAMEDYGGSGPGPQDIGPNAAGLAA